MENIVQVYLTSNNAVASGNKAFCLCAAGLSYIFMSFEQQQKMLPNRPQDKTDEFAIAL